MAEWLDLCADIGAAHNLDELAQTASLIPLRASAAAEASEPDAGAVTSVSQITTNISALNDQVTARAMQMVAEQREVDLERACWLVFGSQARAEQTLATDQDNGLVFLPAAGADAETERPYWMDFGRRVNEALARCGYPLCDGRVMAGQPLCCLTTDEWCRRFEHWMGHGSGNDLIAARIYFDVRPLAGNLELAQPLMALLRSPAVARPRFIKQLADIVLCRPAPLNWLGQVVTATLAGRAVFDLKTGGTALFVDAARLWAFAHRLEPLGTVPRLLAAAHAMRVPAQEAQSWCDGFLALQRLRLQCQRELITGADPQERTRVAWDALSLAQRQQLKQALRAARVVQQRIELDYCR